MIKRNKKGQDKINLDRTTHGMTETRFYEIWTNIQSRCNNSNVFAYKDYGGRGIKCLWSSFEEFKNDMFLSYQQHVKEFGEKQTTIDRTDNDKNYSKENCAWVTRKKNCRNTRRNHLITFQGQPLCITEWEEKLGFNRGTLWARFNKGWSVKRALTTPLRQSKF